MAVEIDSAGQIGDFLNILRKRRAQVVMITLTVVTFGTVFAVIVPRKFVVETRVELLDQEGQVRNPAEAATVKEMPNSESHIKDYQRVKAVLEEDLNDPEYGRLDGAGKHRYIENTRRNIRVSIVDKRGRDAKGSSFVDITYADVDGKRAEEFLKHITNRWVEDVVQREHNQLVRERDEYQNQVDLAEENFEAIAQQWTDLVREMGISLTHPDELERTKEEDPVFVELRKARGERELAEAELEEIRATIDAKTKKYDEMERLVPEQRVEEAVDFQKEIATIEVKIAALRAEQNGKTPEHSRYKVIDIEVEKLEEQIAILEGNERASQSNQVYVENPDRVALKGEIEQLEVQEKGVLARFQKWHNEVQEKSAAHEAQVANRQDLILVDARWDAARAELDEAKARLRKQDAQVRAMESAKGLPYRISQPPMAPDKATEPNPWLIVGMSLFGGLGLGLAVAFIAEFSKSCYRNVQELTRVMGIPVLGAINLIETSADRRRHRLRRAMVGGSTLVFLGGVAWFTYAWEFHPEQLPTSVISVVDDLRMSLR